MTQYSTGERCRRRVNNSRGTSSSNYRRCLLYICGHGAAQLEGRQRFRLKTL